MHNILTVVVSTTEINSFYHPNIVTTVHGVFEMKIIYDPKGNCLS